MATSFSQEQVRSAERGSLRWMGYRERGEEGGKEGKREREEVVVCALITEQAQIVACYALIFGNPVNLFLTYVLMYISFTIGSVTVVY